MSGKKFLLMAGDDINVVKKEKKTRKPSDTDFNALFAHMIFSEKKVIHLQYIGKNEKNISGESSKFWSGWIDGKRVMFRHGVIGNPGREGGIAFRSVYEAQRKLYEKAMEKIKKGYKLKSQNRKGDGQIHYGI